MQLVLQFGEIEVLRRVERRREEMVDDETFANSIHIQGMENMKNDHDGGHADDDDGDDDDVGDDGGV